MQSDGIQDTSEPTFLDALKVILNPVWVQPIVERVWWSMLFVIVFNLLWHNMYSMCANKGFMLIEKCQIII